METKRYEEIFGDRDESGTVKKISTGAEDPAVSPTSGPSVGTHEVVDATNAAQADRSDVSPMIGTTAGSHEGVSGGFNYGYGTWRTTTAEGGTTGDRTLGLLNSFLRGEISAVETYRQAIQKLGGGYPQFTDGMMSHERRVGMLTDKIRSLGGEPATGSGIWGSWAKLVQGTADLFGERSAIAALESGEDHGRNDYRRELENLDSEVRSWVERELIPLEERTHAMMSDLKHAHV